MSEPRTACLVCSTNWPPNLRDPDPVRLLAPLKTVVDHLAETQIRLVSVEMIGAGQSVDYDYCKLVKEHMFGGVSAPRLHLRDIPDDDPGRIAELLSCSAVSARRLGAALWVDLTPGPKSRAAILLGAASAIPDVRIVCSEPAADGFRVRILPCLEDYNSWLGSHGVLVRNYRAEIERAGALVSGSAALPSIAGLAGAVCHFLGWDGGEEQAEALRPGADLMVLAEWLANRAVPEEILGLKWGKKTATEVRDRDIRALGPEAQANKLAARSSQALYHARCLFSHPGEWTRSEGVLLLDLLSYLTQRLQSQVAKPLDPAGGLGGDGLYVAIDGDDVGRRFEEHLAQATSLAAALELRDWSAAVQRQLSRHFLQLSERWGGIFLARTGDGFLAVVHPRARSEIRNEFRPTLPDATVSAGLGPTVKDAYLALKLCKARNRGGGLYMSLAGHEEEILWQRS